MRQLHYSNTDQKEDRYNNRKFYCQHNTSHTLHHIPSTNSTLELF